ncbi:hypothetical protein ACFOKI_12470 [Sphingomonas qilianensis]|uniref:Transposase n=1 Tax=Sphingomonas qilianensis TaxID=1736690 RepID=A0ABU9XNR0_9SPHN
MTAIVGKRFGSTPTRYHPPATRQRILEWCALRIPEWCALRILEWCALRIGRISNDIGDGAPREAYRFIARLD